MRPEFDKPYFSQLQKFLNAEWQANSVYPPPEMIFRCAQQMAASTLCMRDVLVGRSNALF